MRKGSCFFILAILFLHFYNGLIPLAYGQSLVFGPEFFIPDPFYSSLYQIHIFALMQDNSGAPAEHGRFVMLYSSVDQVIMTARTTLPRHAFSNLYSKKGTYEAVITVGLIPLE